MPNDETSGAAGTSPHWVLASDIDNTLTGDRPTLDRLRPRLAEQIARGRLFLVLSTGRGLDDTLRGLSSEGLPEPGAIIAQVGTEIYLPPWTAAAPLAAWDARLKAQFARQEALAFLADIPGLQMQPEPYNTPLKVSCWLDQTPEPEATAAEIKRRIRRAGREEAYRVVWSSGRDLDILPAAAGKGRAVGFLLDYLGLRPERAVVAGDSGNDWTMFQRFAEGIVVANAQPELLEKARQRPGPGIYFARQPFAAGVAEGLEHLGLL